MDDTPDTADVRDADNGAVDAEGGAAASDEVEIPTSTALVEVSPGVAVMFGEVPEGIELIDLDLLPAFDRTQLSTALGMVGNVSTIVGNVAQATVKGLFRLDDQSLALLKSGAELASKDAAKLGTIMKNGKIVGQARLVPAASLTTPSALAAIGPALAMIALQMQLGEIAGLARTNIALTTQTLRTIRNEQWAELEGLAESIDGAMQEARALKTVTDTVWEPIAPSQGAIQKQLKLYRKNVGDHVQELRQRDGSSRRQYLESNAEGIVFDTHALLSSLKTYAQYQALRAGRARARSTQDETEAQLFERITRNTPPEIEESLKEIGQLTESLVRELRIISELPGRATLPLTKQRRDTKASRLTCAQLLEAIEPLANKLHVCVGKLATPETVCAPEDLDLAPYLNVLRWFLEDGEQLRSVAFPYEVGAYNLTGVVPALQAKRVDTAWDALSPGRAGAMAERVVSSTFVAVTDRRILTATPKTLLRHGALDVTLPLDEVRYVRPRANHEDRVRPTIRVTTERRDFHWMFPSKADPQIIDAMTTVINEGASSRTAARSESASAPAEIPSS